MWTHGLKSYSKVMTTPVVQCMMSKIGPFPYWTTLGGKKGALDSDRKWGACCWGQNEKQWCPFLLEMKCYIWLLRRKNLCSWTQLPGVSFLLSELKKDEVHIPQSLTFLMHFHRYSWVDVSVCCLPLKPFPEAIFYLFSFYYIYVNIYFLSNYLKNGPAELFMVSCWK